MACLVLKSSSGERRIGIDEDGVYRYTLAADEYLDHVDPGCNQGTDIDSQLQQNGIRWGDGIAWVTKRLGIKQCAPCVARQEILNHAKENGWKETLRQIKETL